MKFIARRILIAAAVTGSLTLGGCRIDPGETDYESQQFENEEEVDMGGQSFLPGPDPYAEGEARLTFGPFYEGAASDEIPVNDVDNFFFIFTVAGQESFEVLDSNDRVEGFRADIFELRGTSFWGMSIAFFDGDPDDGAMPRPEDLSMWGTMHVSLKSDDAGFNDFTMGIATADGEASVSVTDYGYENNGEWHTLEIPLEDFGLDLSTVTTPLIFGGQNGAAGEQLLVDNFYYTAP